MSGLSEFLSERYREARAREESAWTIRPDVPFEWTHIYDQGGEYCEVGVRKQHVPVDEFVSEYGQSAADPAVLAEIDSKQAIVDEHPDVNDGDCGTCVTGRWGYPTHSGSSPQRHPCRTLRLLAMPYADHPDYREEWKP